MPTSKLPNRIELWMVITLSAWFGRGSDYDFKMSIQEQRHTEIPKRRAPQAPTDLASTLLPIDVEFHAGRRKQKGPVNLAFV